MNKLIERLLLSKYLPRDSESYFQAKVMAWTHIVITLLIVSILPITLAQQFVMAIMGGIIALSLLSIVIIKLGYLTSVSIITYSGISLLATIAVFTRPVYQNFEVYTLVTFNMFITLMASLLTHQRIYTYFTTGIGVFYLILLLFVRGLNMTSAENPLEIDDYFIGTTLLILTGFIIRSTLDRRKRLLDIAEHEAHQNLQQSLILKESLEEKEVLLHEVHHRVKNNLNVAISLLNMQIRKLEPTDTATITLQDSIGRLNSMALVHERLYAGKSLKELDFRPYITAILHAVMRSLQKSNITFEINVEDDISIELAKAVPCG